MKTWQNEFVELLRAQYDLQKKKNPSYSIRAFARDLETPHGPLAGILKGSQKWNFSSSWADAVLTRLKISRSRINLMRAKMGLNPKLDMRKIQISSGICSHWAYWPIYCFFGLPTPPSTKEISKRLNVTEAKIKEITEDLIARKYLVRVSSKRIHHPGQNLGTDDDFPQEAFKDIHRTYLRMADDLIKNLNIEQRELQTFTLTGSMSALPEVKQEIRLFADRVAHLLNRGDKNDEVFRFSVQLFPFIENKDET